MALYVSATAPCSVRNLDDCGDANQLVWSSDLQPAIQAFFGKARGSYLNDNALLSEQTEQVLSGAPDIRQHLPSGEWLFTACQAHDCGNKGAIVFDNAGEIEAVGIISFDCHRVPPGQVGCERAPELTIFVKHAFGVAKQPYYDVLVDWAEKRTQEDRRSMGSIVGPFQGVSVRGILDEKELAAKSKTIP